MLPNLLCNHLQAFYAQASAFWPPFPCVWKQNVILHGAPWGCSEGMRGVRVDAAHSYVPISYLVCASEPLGFVCLCLMELCEMGLSLIRQQDEVGEPGACGDPQEEALGWEKQSGRELWKLPAYQSR